MTERCPVLHRETDLQCQREAGHPGWHRVDVPEEHPAYDQAECQVIEWLGVGQ